MARVSTAPRYRTGGSALCRGRKRELELSEPESDNEHDEHQDDHENSMEEEEHHQEEAQEHDGDNQDAAPQPSLTVSQHPISRQQQHTVPTPAAVENMQPRFAALETILFGQISAQLDMRSRLAAMEHWAIGAEMPGSALHRIEQLELFTGIREP